MEVDCDTCGYGSSPCGHSHTYALHNTNNMRVDGRALLVERKLKSLFELFLGFHNYSTAFDVLYSF